MGSHKRYSAQSDATIHAAQVSKDIFQLVLKRAVS